MSAETVNVVIDDLGALLLFTMILIVAAGQIYRAIYAVAAQSFLIAVAGAVLARATGNVDLWVIAGITLAVKAIALPWVLHRVVQRMNVRREVEPVLPVPATLALAVSRVVARDLGGEPARVAEVSARFTGMVPMPATLSVHGDDDDRARIRFDVVDATGIAVLTDGQVCARSDASGGTDPR